MGLRIMKVEEHSLPASGSSSTGTAMLICTEGGSHLVALSLRKRKAVCKEVWTGLASESPERVLSPPDAEWAEPRVQEVHRRRKGRLAIRAPYMNSHPPGRLEDRKASGVPSKAILPSCRRAIRSESPQALWRSRVATTKVRPSRW